MNILTEIQQAARNRHLVHITYVDSKGNISDRITEPYELSDDSFYGYDTEKGSIRRFKVNGIQSAKEVKDSSFSPRFPMKI